MTDFKAEEFDRKTLVVTCHTCGLASKVPSDKPLPHMKCPRCNAALHWRKPDSVARTSALIIAAYIMYVPANLLPITVVTSFGKAQADTIISGVLYFLATGMWPIALVIFVASVAVPILKLFVLTYLVASVKLKSAWRPLDRTKLYRITEAVGRWSMVDIYVVTILVALVKMGKIATIEAGPAAKYFGAVVVLTMLAAMSFDPKLIWDAAKEKEKHA